MRFQKQAKKMLAWVLSLALLLTGITVSEGRKAAAEEESTTESESVVITSLDLSFTVAYVSAEDTLTVNLTGPAGWGYTSATNSVSVSETGDYEVSFDFSEAENVSNLITGFYFSTTSAEVSLNITAFTVNGVTLENAVMYDETIYCGSWGSTNPFTYGDDESDIGTVTEDGYEYTFTREMTEYETWTQVYVYFVRTEVTEASTETDTSSAGASETEDVTITSLDLSFTVAYVSAEDTMTVNLTGPAGWGYTSATNSVSVSETGDYEVSFDFSEAENVSNLITGFYFSTTSAEVSLNITAFTVNGVTLENAAMYDETIYCGSWGSTNPFTYGDDESNIGTVTEDGYEYAFTREMTEYETWTQVYVYFTRVAVTEDSSDDSTETEAPTEEPSATPTPTATATESSTATPSEETEETSESGDVVITSLDLAFTVTSVDTADTLTVNLSGPAAWGWDSSSESVEVSETGSYTVSFDFSSGENVTNQINGFYFSTTDATIKLKVTELAVNGMTLEDAAMYGEEITCSSWGSDNPFSFGEDGELGTVTQDGYVYTFERTVIEYTNWTNICVSFTRTEAPKTEEYTVRFNAEANMTSLSNATVAFDSSASLNDDGTATVTSDANSIVLLVTPADGYGFSSTSTVEVKDANGCAAYDSSASGLQSSGKFKVTLTISGDAVLTVTASAEKASVSNGTAEEENALNANVDLSTVQEVESTIVEAFGEEAQADIESGDAYTSIVLTSTATSASALTADETEKLQEDFLSEVQATLSNTSLTADHLNVAAYLDITLEAVLKYYDSSSEEQSQAITDLGTNEITININIPSDIAEPAENVTRSYYIVRLHKEEDGSYTRDILPCTENGDGTLSFKSAKFSTYVLYYADVEKKSTSSSGKHYSSGTVTATATPEATASPEVTDTPEPETTASPEATDTVDSTTDETTAETVEPDADVSSEETEDGEEIAAEGTTTSAQYTDAATKSVYTVTSAKKKTVAFAGTAANKKAITIPSTVKIDGVTYKVTAIEKGALKGNTKLKKVTIGKNIKTIGKNAFKNCKNLKKIVIKSTKLRAKNTGANAFKGIAKKAAVTVPKGKVKAYKKLLQKKGAGSKIKVKK